MGIFMSFLCLVLGCWLCIKGVISYFRMKSLEKDGVITTAIIIDVIREESQDIETGTYVSYWPIYEYTDVFGIKHQHRPSSTTGLVKFIKGQEIEIAYYPGKVDEILVLTKIGKLKDVFGFILSGLFSITIGVSILIHNGYLDIIFN